MAFVKKEIKELQLNPFVTIGDEWFLLTAGTPEDYNTMTASWGAMGVIWGGPAMTAVVRTSRRTFGYMEENDTFSVCVFPEQQRKALQFCGTHSGRDFDKAKETGLTPVELDGTTVFAEAKFVLICEKMYAQMMGEEHFTQPEICEKWYGTDPMHKMYIGRIKAAYVQE
ncbi:MAG: flavin reductase [Oscillospiraceae bacterium]|nr:flavin reductase [Oscillospiraceae bacterium]